MHAFLQSDGSPTSDERAPQDFVLALTRGAGWAHVARRERLEVLGEGRPAAAALDDRVVFTVEPPVPVDVHGPVRRVDVVAPGFLPAAREAELGEWVIAAFGTLDEDRGLQGLMRGAPARTGLRPSAGGRPCVR